ncbi:peroxide stress protein YaaA [Marinilabiliaceae bacterium ANBcel2]|nr:peroxide stress protein YaaA [Marinilabiliaceae bacterium ANBcel2]
MLAIVSCAKKMDFKRELPKLEFSSHTRFYKEAEYLVENLQKKSALELSQMMNMSSQLGILNAERYFQWSWPNHQEMGRAALYAFTGEVFASLSGDTLEFDDLYYSQDSLRIISGLYGLLRPLDLILPYRLEMSTRLKTSKANDLYGFWRDKITNALNQDLLSYNHKALVDLASKEYYRAIDSSALSAPVITPVFKENKNGKYKTVVLYAKRARGLMARFIIENRLTDPEEIKAFDLEGYHYNNELSKGYQYVFTRH